MNNWGSTGITSMTLISSIILMSASSSFIFEGSDDLEKNAEVAINDALNEISNYLVIEEAIGKYYLKNNEKIIDRILIYVKQFITGLINISELKIKIINNNDLTILSYSGYSEKISSKPLFSHEIWSKTNNSFSVIVSCDEDCSIINYNFMNYDRCYLAINLPESFAMKKGEKITISIIPSKGIISSIECKTPSLQISNIVNFIEI